MHAEVQVKLERLKTTVHERFQQLATLRQSKLDGAEEIERLKAEKIPESRALKSTAEIANLNASAQELQEKVVTEASLAQQIGQARDIVRRDAGELKMKMELKMTKMDVEVYLLEQTLTQLADSVSCVRERRLMGQEEHATLELCLHDTRRDNTSDLRNGWMRSATQANIAKNKEIEAAIRALER